MTDNETLPLTGQEKDIFEVARDFDDLDISRNEIECSLGYLDNKIPVHFGAIVNDILLQQPKRCKTRAGYHFLGTEKTNKPGRWPLCWWNIF